MVGEWNAPADKYEILQKCRAAFLQHLAVIAREGGISERDAIEALQNGAGKYYDQIVSNTRRGSFEASRGLTASRISLVGESELELEIELGDLSRRLYETQHEALRPVYLRFVTLLNRPNLSAEENPVSIDSIIQGMTAMFAKLAGGSEQSAAMLELLESSLNRHLPDIYSHLCDILKSYNIKPALANIQSHGGHGRHRDHTGQRVSDSPIAATPALQTAASSVAVAAAHPLFALQNAMLTKQTAASAVAAPLSAVSMEMLNQLFARLEMLETKGTSTAPLFPQGSAALPGEDTPVASNLHLPKANDIGLPLTGPEAAVIDTLALIFAAIFDHPTLPDAIKSAIGNLQITILKVAMLDASFFTASTHPARIVLDKMARAALGLPHNVSHEHPVCVAIGAIATRLRAEFESDMQIFAGYIAELDALIAQREEAFAESARTYVLLIEKWENQERATEIASETVEKLIASDTPSEIVNFIRYDWVRLLQLDLLEHGEGSQQWQRNLAVVTDLLWSIKPMQSVEDRKRLAAKVPGLLARINAGFERIQISKAERDAFMDSCFSLQTSALRAALPVGKAIAAENAGLNYRPADFSSHVSRPARPEFEEIRIDDLLVKVWRGSEQDDAMDAVDKNQCQIGDWLDFSVPGSEQPVCGRMSWNNPNNASYLFCNPDWSYAISIAPAQLQQELRNRRAKIRSTESLFDLAVAKALRQT